MVLNNGLHNRVLQNDKLKIRYKGHYLWNDINFYPMNGWNKMCTSNNGRRLHYWSFSLSPKVNWMVEKELCGKNRLTARTMSKPQSQQYHVGNMNPKST